MLRTFKRVHRYIRYDLKEIIAPSPLPDPPGEKPKKFSFRDVWTVQMASLGAPAALYTLCMLLMISVEKCDQDAGLLQALRFGTRDYLDTLRKSKEQTQPEGKGPEEPPIIEELRECLAHNLCSCCLSLGRDCCIAAPVILVTK